MDAKSEESPQNWVRPEVNEKRRLNPGPSIERRLSAEHRFQGILERTSNSEKNKPKGSNRFWRNSNTWTEFVNRSKIHLPMLALMVGVNFIPFRSQAILDMPSVQTPPVPQIMESNHFPPPLEVKIAQTFEKDIFTTFTPEEKAIAEKEINQEFDHFKNQTEQIRNTLRWKDLVKQTVDDPRLKIPEGEKEYWTQAMLQLIFIESGGDPKADPADIIINPVAREEAKKTSAKGLTQIKPESAKKQAKDYEIFSYDLYNPWDNTFLGLAHQLSLTKNYGKSLSIWAHHQGFGNMNEAISTYTISVGKESIKNVDEAYEDPFRGPKEFVNKFRLNPVKLLNSPAVTGKLKQIGAFEDLTERYFYRWVAAGRAMFGDQTRA